MKRDTYGATIDQIDIVSAKVLLYCHKAWLDPSTRIDLLVGIEELRPQGIWNCKNTIILSFFRSELKQMLQQVLKIQPLLAPPLKKYLCTVSIFNIPDKSYRSQIINSLSEKIGPIVKITIKRMKNGSNYYSFIQFENEEQADKAMKIGSFQIGEAEVEVKEYLCEYLVKKNKRVVQASKIKQSDSEKLNLLKSGSSPIPSAQVRPSSPERNSRNDVKAQRNKTSFQKMVRDLRRKDHEVSTYRSDEIRFNTVSLPSSNNKKVRRR